DRRAMDIALSSVTGTKREGGATRSTSRETLSLSHLWPGPGYRIVSSHFGAGLVFARERQRDVDLPAVIVSASAKSDTLYGAHALAALEVRHPRTPVSLRADLNFGHSGNAILGLGLSLAYRF